MSHVCNCVNPTYPCYACGAGVPRWHFGQPARVMPLPVVERPEWAAPGLPCHIHTYSASVYLSPRAPDAVDITSTAREVARTRALARLAKAYGDTLLPVAMQQIVSWVEDCEPAPDQGMFVVVTVYVRHEGALRGYRPKESTS